MLPFFILFGLLNAILLFHWKARTAAQEEEEEAIISTQECYMATLGLGAIALLLRYNGLDRILLIRRDDDDDDDKMRKKKKKSLQKTTFFTISFLLLSICEVLFTIVSPWAIIVFYKDETAIIEQQQQQQHSAMIAHLFAFQAQIAWEACLMGRQGGADVELFLYTAIANAYRGWILFQTWPLSLQDPASRTIVDMTIWRLTTALWCFSSFVFMPLIWYPCLDKSKE
jgi:hypothetical protein